MALNLVTNAHFRTCATHVRKFLRQLLVPALKPWTPCTHALWPLSQQRSVHMAVVVFWKLRKLTPMLHLSLELMELILKRTV